MIVHEKKFSSCKRIHEGRGLINSTINKLPFELHLPGYNFCGPGTKLQKRLDRGDSGINLLDEACKEHDIAYSKYKDINNRHIADKILAEKAWERAKSNTSSLGERTSAWLVANMMKAKVKFGMGLNKRKSKTKLKKVKCKTQNGKQLFKRTLQNVKTILKQKKPQDMTSSINLALKTAKNAFERKKSLVEIPRIIPLPKVGGILPLLPIFAGLSALGAITGGVAHVAKAVNSAREAKQQLAENVRHNKQMEAIALGKGLYLQPHKKGLGLYLNPQPKNF